jgi:acetate kinase
LNHVASGQVEGIGATAKGSASAVGEKTELQFDPSAGRVDHEAAMGAIIRWLERLGYASGIIAVGHRVVHGGPNLTVPMLVDDATLAKLRALIPLAPLHQPHNLAGIEAARKAFPSNPQVACFDTSFHRSHPFVSDTFALPRAYYDEGVRRYGFHGLSYEYITRRLFSIAPQIAREDVIVAHLGNGASMCAISNGRSMASTMGFTALDGLPMGTRCGQLDPGVLLFLMAEKKMSAQAISDLLYKNSGLKGMSGISQDMRELEASDSPAARDAIDYFVHRIRRELGGLAATVDGVEGVVFTGGIGEHSWRVRKAVLTGMEWMGVQLDDEANRASAQIISAKTSPAMVFVIETDEEQMIAEHTAKVAKVAGEHPISA